MKSDRNQFRNDNYTQQTDFSNYRRNLYQTLQKLFRATFLGKKQYFSLTIILTYHLLRGSALPFSIDLAVGGSSFSSTIRMQIPRSSIPRRPARPLICIYSPLDNHLNLSPSNLRTLVKTTVFAGMFKPMLKVSVANKH